jgi:hypothetical protein
MRCGTDRTDRVCRGIRAGWVGICFAADPFTIYSNPVVRYTAWIRPIIFIGRKNAFSLYSTCCKNTLTMVAYLQLSIMGKNQLFKYVGRMMCKEQLYINQ